MLVKFAIDPEALNNAENAAFDSLYRNWWGPHGVLADPQGLGSALDCNSKYSDELRVARDNFEKNGWPLFHKICPIEWQSILGDSDNDLAKYSGEFSLALLDNDRADLLDVPKGNSGKYSRNCGGVEAARFQHADLSTNFASAKLLSEQAIHIEQNTADLWRERFQNLVRYSNGNQQITIVDRYIASNIYYNHNYNHNELFRLLELISADSSGCSVTIFSSDSRVNDFAYVKDRIESALERIGLRKDGISRLTVFICNDDVFGRSAHDRYIRFDGMTCAIGVGIEIFRYDVVRRETEFSLKSPEHFETYRRRENQLRKRKRFPPWRWPA